MEIGRLTGSAGNGVSELPNLSGQPCGPNPEGQITPVILTFPLYAKVKISWDNRNYAPYIKSDTRFRNLTTCRHNSDTDFSLVELTKRPTA